MTSTLHRTPLATAGLALVVALGGCGGGGGDSRETPPYVPKATTVDATTPAPAAEPLTIASPMFADGAPIPVQFSCKGANVAPPLTWSSPAGAAELALVVDNHHHIVCRSCGVIADVDCAVGEAPCLTASDHNGFLLDEAEVIYWGLCPDCSISDTSRSHP